MVDYFNDVKVTIPEMDISNKKAATVKEAPARFRIWWDDKDGRGGEPYTQEDISVPNEMVIVKY